MALSENDIELIENYLDQSLSDLEKDMFEKRIKNSKEFANQFEIAKTTLHSLKKEHDLKIKETLKVIYHASKSTETLRINRKFYWMAAAILILALSPALYWYFATTVTTEDLYLSHYEVYPATPNVRGKNETSLYTAMEYYRKGNYTTALELFLEYEEQYPQADHVLIYIGNCYLNLNETKTAIDVFQEANKSTDIIIKQTSNWYLALSYLKSGQLDHCRDLLNNMIDKNKLYAKEAQQLLSEIH